MSTQYDSETDLIECHLLVLSLTKTSKPITDTRRSLHLSEILVKLTFRKESAEKGARTFQSAWIHSLCNVGLDTYSR